MTLALHQRLLKEALAAPGFSSEDYVACVQARVEWRLLRRSIVFWRTLAVSRGAPLTAGLLHRQGRLNELIESMLAAGVASPYSETMADTFLKRVGRDADDIAAALARTEIALQLVGRVDRTIHVIRWPTDPLAVLAATLDQASIGQQRLSGAWRLHVAHDLPGFISAERLD